MALNEPDLHAPRGLRQLMDDEDGTAAVEFIVLMPVYLTLMVAVFALTFMLLARQGLASATRFQAFHGELGAEALQPAFFTPGFGTYSGSSSTEQVLSEDTVRRSLQPQDREGDVLGGGNTGTATSIASEFILNEHGQGGVPYELHKVRGSFAYAGLELMGSSPLNIVTQAAILRPRSHERPEHESGQQRHYITEVDSPNAFDPDSDDNRYQPPLVGRLQQDVSSGPDASSDPGVWDVRSRLGGSDFSEHSLFDDEIPR